MGRAPCCDKANVKRGPWSPEEDATLKNYLQTHGIGGNWIALPLKAGLKRCGKSCRLRWLNYLRPDIKHGGFTEEEDNIICTLYSQMGSRWSLIASQLPGRTDNDVKNYWNTKLKKKLLAAGKSSSFHNDNNNNGGFGFLNGNYTNIPTHHHHHHQQQQQQQQQQQPDQPSQSLLCLPKIETNYNISTPMLGYEFSVSGSSSTCEYPVMNFTSPDKITHVSQSGLNLDNSHNNIVVVSSQEGYSLSDSNTGNGYGEDTGNIHVLMDDIIIDQQLSVYDHQFPCYEFVNGEINNVNVPSCFDHHSLADFSTHADIKPNSTTQGGLNQSVVNRY